MSHPHLVVSTDYNLDQQTCHETVMYSEGHEHVVIRTLHIYYLLKEHCCNIRTACRMCLCLGTDDLNGNYNVKAHCHFST